MNTPKQILKKTLATVFFCGCASFVLGGTPPFFPTDITDRKSTRLNSSHNA